ncbi:MAG: hypothetical protein E7425_13745 [Ruminococcaceae bacterium]|jgi:uncharacterized protein involved in type VI secretion and phage assembly|nr:hypothetical protein [Oscillospiraceae bacterium]
MSPPGISEQLEAMMQATGKHMGQGSVFSLTLATVKNINDEDKLNRVKCLPIGAPDEEMTDWCYVMSPMGGSERGLFLFPQVDDLVVLGYLENDPHRPIVLGSFWNTETKPPETVADGKAEEYRLKTPHNIDMSLHDEDGKQKITVTMPKGTVVEVDDDKETVTTKNKAGDTSMVMKMKDGEIELKAKEKITLSSGGASITLEKNGNITIKGSGDVVLDGKTVSGKAKAGLSMQGMDVSIKANKDVNVNATATANVKGTLLKLN